MRFNPKCYSYSSLGMSCQPALCTTTPAELLLTELYSSTIQYLLALHSCRNILSAYTLHLLLLPPPHSAGPYCLPTPYTSSCYPHLILPDHTVCLHPTPPPAAPTSFCRTILSAYTLHLLLLPHLILPDHTVCLHPTPPPATPTSFCRTILSAYTLHLLLLPPPQSPFCLEVKLCFLCPSTQELSVESS